MEFVWPHFPYWFFNSTIRRLVADLGMCDGATERNSFEVTPRRRPFVERFETFDLKTDTWTTVPDHLTSSVFVNKLLVLGLSSDSIFEYFNEKTIRCEVQECICSHSKIEFGMEHWRNRYEIRLFEIRLFYFYAVMRPNPLTPCDKKKPNLN